MPKQRCQQLLVTRLSDLLESTRDARHRLEDSNMDLPPLVRQDISECIQALSRTEGLLHNTYLAERVRAERGRSLVRLTCRRVHHTVDGITSGRYEYQTFQVDHSNSDFQGAPMGRGSSMMDSVEDLRRRLALENRELDLSTYDLEIYVREDRD